MPKAKPNKHLKKDGNRIIKRTRLRIYCFIESLSLLVKGKETIGLQNAILFIRNNDNHVLFEDNFLYLRSYGKKQKGKVIKNIRITGTVSGDQFQIQKSTFLKSFYQFS